MLRRMQNWSGDETRQALRRFMRARKLKMLPWTERADISEGTLRNFLKGRTSSLTERTLDALARAEKVSVAEMLGAPELSDAQRRAAEIAAALVPEDLEAWLRFGASRAREQQQPEEPKPDDAERHPFRARG